MSTATLPHESSEPPPARTGAAVYPMQTQRRPLRVVYAVAPAAFAVAALSDPLARTVADGVGLAIRLAVGGATERAGAVDGGSGEGGGDTAAALSVVPAMSGHSLSILASE